MYNYLASVLRLSTNNVASHLKELMINWTIIILWSIMIIIDDQ